MGLPGNINTIILTGTYLDFQGFPQSGTLTFTPNAGPFDDSATPAVLTGIPIAAGLTTAGTFAVTLPCTDNTSLQPTGFSYQVQENLSGGSRAYFIQLPHTLGSTVDIATLIPVSPAPAVSTVYAVLAFSNTFTGASNIFQGGLTANDGLSLGGTGISSVASLAIADPATGSTPGTIEAVASGHAATGRRLLGCYGTGDSADRFTIDYDGKHQWAPSPGGTFDATLSRSGTSQLTMGASLILGGRLSTTGTAGAAVAGAQAGSSAPTPIVVAGSNDARGRVTFGTGTGSAAGAMAIVTLNGTFASAPYIQLTPTNAATAALTVYVASVGANNFTISVANAPTDSQGNGTYSVNYLCIG